MADNLPQNGGGIIATDEVTVLNGGTVSPVHVQRVKATFGPDGSAQDVSSDEPLPTEDGTVQTLLALIQSSLAMLSYNTNSAMRVDLVNGITATTNANSVMAFVGVSGGGTMSAAYDQYGQMMIGATAIRSQITTS